MPDEFAAACAALGIETTSESRQVHYHRARAVSGAVVQDWDVADTTLRLLWPVPGAEVSIQEVAALTFAVDHVVSVDSTEFDPQLRLFTATGDPAGAPTWAQLATVIGRIPYWPTRLRVFEVIRHWRPGAVAATVAPIPAVDLAPAGRLAAILPAGSPARRVVDRVMVEALASAAADTRDEVNRLSAETWARVLDIAAIPLDISGEALPESVAWQGWCDIMERADDLSASLVREAGWVWTTAWRPFEAIDDIDPDSVTGAAWAEQLVPVRRECQPAKFEMVRDPDPTNEETEHLVDPYTGVPAIRYHSRRLRYAAPASLPTDSPLTEVVLDHQQIWIRDGNGVLYPAPRVGPVWGLLGYGHKGGRAHTLAVLLDRLLTDIGAPGASPSDTTEAASAGLLTVTETTWPDRTVISRAKLETAAATRGD
ncbi:hypothetical protein [Nocardia sp. NBC_01388]|uniref:hypothetical protein n=1 Tax=Nocardia sp. NBC_01388 TaxID=2903596 RepID=UPI003243C98D